MAAYNDLLAYYRECFELIDTFHFNSEVSRKEFEKILGNCIGETVPITHGDIVDNRSYKKFSDKGLIVGFIGNETPYKGLKVICDTIKDLDIDLMVWGGKKKEGNRVHYRGMYGKDMLHEVFSEMDLLVVPSIWKETFSLVTVEALSFGVPVLVSDNVGAQDVVKEYAPEFVYHTVKELKSLLTELVADKKRLVDYNKRICELSWKHDLNSHTEEIIDKIYKI